jgi:hypothetical protein
MLGCRSVSQFFIVTAVPIQDIEAQHPEVRRQPTEMGIQNKTKFLQLRHATERQKVCTASGKRGKR